jgi:hypothetical protein
MISPGASAEAYALARRTLLEAAEALQKISQDGFVLVGAHAVYLRAPEQLLGLPAFTYDGDLVVNPRRIVHAAIVKECMEAAAFELRGRMSGLYVRRGIPEPQAEAARVDLLVPEGTTHAWSAERYDSRATHVQPGLEVCLYDHSTMHVTTLDDGRAPIAIELEVAGVVGLILAKAWKLAERAAAGADAFADVTKDVSDVYRLLRVSDVEATIATLQQCAHHRDALDCARRGAEALREVMAPNGPGQATLRSMIVSTAEAERAALSLGYLSQRFADAVDTAIA